MKFVFEYRTSDNIKHIDTINAANRDAAFMALKSRGIKPGRLVEAPGFMNKLLGRGKRWMLILVLLLIIAGLLIFPYSSNTETVAVKDDVDSTVVYKDDGQMVRRQIFGDVAHIEKGVRSGWDEVFTEPGDRFLASFAIPGMEAGFRSVAVVDLLRALDNPVFVKESDTIEAKQIKHMVEGMKREAKRFIEQGGTIEEYAERLVQRQEYEISIYNKAKREIEMYAKSGASEEDVEMLWERRNDELRAIGIRLIHMPELNR